MRASNASIGIDLMGSDSPPEELLQAVLSLSQELDSVNFTLFGTEAFRYTAPRITFVPTKEVIQMDDEPLTALRRKKNSSLCTGMRLLQKKEIDAFISAGNTGALMACAKLYLPMLNSIDRPALLALLPTKQKPIAVLDVGANVTFKADQLVQFASIGIAYQKCRGILHPTVGLLNSGSEARKGTSELREAYKKLQLFNRESAVFLGNIEGRDAFSGKVDVLITDGFTGNVFLKTAEGVAAFILETLGQTAEETASSHLKKILSDIHHRLHYTEFPGAILCGIDGIVVKCHGNLSRQNLSQSIKASARLVEHSFLEKIKTQLQLETHRFRLSSIFKR